MSDITGTIFPMYDKTGNYRRFPETVIEAVLGLPSYLQTQFSSLANIYMPIEGIHEAKTGQEFVYRATPNTIKANLLNLDKIYGKSLGWNQLVRFTSCGQSGVSYDSTNNTINITNVTAGYFQFERDSDTYLISGHKYLVLVNVIESASTLRLFIGNDGTSLDFGVPNSGSYAAVGRYAAIADLNISSNMLVTGWLSSNATIKFQLNLFDLTLLFNGNVPEDYTVADFERDFPELYYPYDSGKLINNDAESVECVGRNVWDEEWESGYYTQEGADYADNHAIRSKNFSPVIPNTPYYFHKAYGGRIYFYDANKTLLGRTESMSTDGEVVTPSNCNYIKFFVYADSVANYTYNYDICINLSDTSFNGQYEPYWKKDLHLGLGNFKVKSPNIWDEEWEVGEFVGGSLNSKNFISVSPSTTYYFKSPQSNAIFYYDTNHNQISTGEALNTTFTTPANCAFIKFSMSTDYGTTYNHDITINKSDPAFNGRYFSHEDITITGGLKGNGDWADMIVGNKYMKKAGRVDLGSLEWTYEEYNGHGRFSTPLSVKIASDFTFNQVNTNGYISNTAPVASNNVNLAIAAYENSIYLRNDAYTDATTFKAAMNGVMLDYQLANYETYELVTPIATSLRAGTTEARISPNSYGLSAPMVCDITYSVVQDASSAGDAQYSVTAGKLLNTRKIWGQDFNGEGDVTGAMSGVTTIAASGNITTAAQLVSTVAQGTAPLSVVSKTPVTNLCAEFASKLETTRTIWGRDFNGSANVSGALTGVTTINMSDTLTLAGSTDATRRIYFGDSNHYLELKDIGTPGTPNLVFHFSDGVFSDGFMSAFGTSGSVSPAVPSPLLIDCDTWNSGRTIGYIITSVLSNAISKYLDGYTIIITDVDTDISYTVIGTDGDMELYLSGGKTITSSE